MATLEAPPLPWVALLGKQQLLEAAAADFDALVPSADRPSACRALALLLRVRRARQRALPCLGAEAWSAHRTPRCCGRRSAPPRSCCCTTHA